MKLSKYVLQPCILGIICYPLVKWRIDMAKLIKLFSQIFQLDHRNEVESKIKRHEEIWSDTYPAQLISQNWD